MPKTCPRMIQYTVPPPKSSWLPYMIYSCLRCENQRHRYQDFMDRLYDSWLQRSVSFHDLSPNLHPKFIFLPLIFFRSCIFFRSIATFHQLKNTLPSFDPKQTNKHKQTIFNQWWLLDVPPAGYRYSKWMAELQTSTGSKSVPRLRSSSCQKSGPSLIGAKWVPTVEKMMIRYDKMMIYTWHMSWHMILVCHIISKSISFIFGTSPKRPGVPPMRSRNPPGWLHDRIVGVTIHPAPFDDLKLTDFRW